jgi:hypothetical protein
MSIQIINDLALSLVARDFSDGHGPDNAGPTKTSRALAIVHLAAHDAFAKVTGKLTPQLKTLPDLPQGINNDEATGIAALIAAGICAAELLYPTLVDFLRAEIAKLTEQGKLNLNSNPSAVNYGKLIAATWLEARKNDLSSLPQLDNFYNIQPGHHRPDPLDLGQLALGRNWGQVTPFVIGSVINDAFLEPPPALNSPDYGSAFDEVAVCGKDNITEKSADFRDKAVIGIFWGYDGSNKLGTPPRLYNQVVRAIPELLSNSLPQAMQIKILTAINVAMADAGIAAWYWKYEYDFWRPVLGIREADRGWGATGQGDSNTTRQESGDPFWLPLGAPRSNPFPNPIFGAKGNNFTPNFPAYPSGHATFGAACFETVALILGKKPEDITVKFVSDEFNGKTTDNTGIVRPKLECTFNLRQGIQDNNLSRIYLGVHWIFDATGGEKVGSAIAEKVATAFQ